MPRKKSALQKHVQGKKFNKEMGVFFLNQKKKSRKLWRKMKNLGSIVNEDGRSRKAQRSFLCKYLKVEKDFNDVCTYVES